MKLLSSLSFKLVTNDFSSLLSFRLVQFKTKFVIVELLSCVASLSVEIVMEDLAVILLKISCFNLLHVALYVTASHSHKL